jgi:hypothetical protein
MSHGPFLLAVYPDAVWPDVAERLAEVDVDPAQVRVDDPGDARLALRAEQVEEASSAVFSPQVGILLPKEAGKATGLVVPIGAILGAVLVLPFSFVPMGSLDLWVRALWLAVIGAAAGATIAAIVAPALAAKDAFAASLLERGTVVRIDDDRPELRSALADLRPIRLDAVASDGSIERLTTEEDPQDGGVLEETVDTVRRETSAPPHERHR